LLLAVRIQTFTKTLDEYFGHAQLLLLGAVVFDG
jgi:hypothetical protein